MKLQCATVSTKLRSVVLLLRPTKSIGWIWTALDAWTRRSRLLELLKLGGCFVCGRSPRRASSGSVPDGRGQR